MKIKQEYLKRVKKILKNNRVNNIDEILSDINEVFDAKIAEGKNMQTIIAELGRPENVVKQYIGEINQKTKDKTSMWVSCICIFAFFFVSFTVSTVLVACGVLRVYKYSDDMYMNVYLKSSETQFNNENITITLKNIADKDFEDKIIHLTYVDSAKQHVGFDSEQKVVTIVANDETVITFVNPGWEYSEYNEIYACVKNSKTESWTILKNGREFAGIEDDKTTVILCYSMIFGTLALVFFLLDIDCILKLKKVKK